MKFVASTLLSCLLLASAASAYTAEDREASIKWVTGLGFPNLKAWSMMTPKMLKTVLNIYTTSMKEDSFEYFTPAEIEVVYAAVSASNNCELCLSFHSMMMGKGGHASDDIKEIVAGGLPKEKKIRGAVVAAKYALAHKGVFLDREKKHLKALGYEGEKLAELNFMVGLMSSMNQNYVHLISEGLEVEEFLQQAGPFADTVYAHGKDDL